MREIKFRAWIKEQKRMVVVGGIAFDNPIQIEVPRIGKENMSILGWSHPENFEFWHEGTEGYLMQYTGLHDKSGKEIYESDLLKDTMGDVRIVIFEDGGFWLKYPNGQMYMPAEGRREVIGNIYENPELLKEA